MGEELIERDGLAAGAELENRGGEVWGKGTGVAGFEGGEEGVYFGVGGFGDVEGGGEGFGLADEGFALALGEVSWWRKVEWCGGRGDWMG